MTIRSTDRPVAPTSIPATKPTRQKRGLERGKASHKKNPGKRAKSGGCSLLAALSASPEGLRLRRFLQCALASHDHRPPAGLQPFDGELGLWLCDRLSAKGVGRDAMVVAFTECVLGVAPAPQISSHVRRCEQGRRKLAQVTQSLQALANAVLPGSTQLLEALGITRKTPMKNVETLRDGSANALPLGRASERTRSPIVSEGQDIEQCSLKQGSANHIRGRPCAHRQRWRGHQRHACRVELDANGGQYDRMITMAPQFLEGATKYGLPTRGGALTIGSQFAQRSAQSAQADSKLMNKLFVAGASADFTGVS